MKNTITSANPYMPLWEHVPDGEPRVFEYNGEKRIYVYGSHDTRVTEYCGDDYVVWSAPVSDLTDWTCHGTCYRAMSDRPLYAPDVVCKDGVYYMYVAEKQGSEVYVVRSSSPAGPFTDPVLTQLGFDPGILVDDDGRVYAYWGFCGSYAAELEDDMATIKEGTLVENLIGHAEAPWMNDRDHIDPELAFFEASSPRKVGGRYVLIYSARYTDPRPELGVYGPCNGFLSYVYSDSPLGGFKKGGDISFNGGEIINAFTYDQSERKTVRDAGVAANPDLNGNASIDSDGQKHKKGLMTYQWGNNHGSIMKIRDQWYVFYHRQTGTNEYTRQAMVEPVEVAVDPDGKVYIGAVDYDAEGRPVGSHPVEMTSQGFNTDGLDAYSLISAGYACHIYDDSGLSIYSVSAPDGAVGVAEASDDEALRKAVSRKPLVLPVFTPDSGISSEHLEKLMRDGRVDLPPNKDGEHKGAYTLGIAYDKPGVYSSPIFNLYDGATVGFKYLQFGETGAASVTVNAYELDRFNDHRKSGDADAGDKYVSKLSILVYIDSPVGELIATINGREGELGQPVPLLKAVTGRHAVYFEFASPDPDKAYAFDSFTFD